MKRKIALVAETGSDIPPRLAGELDVYLVPMHVTMGPDTLDDGSFPPQEVCAYYNRTGKVPTTSASNPDDFERVFQKIRQEDENRPILHLAYSAVTTCSYQNALLAAEGREGIVSVDTKQVSVGQAVAVIETAKWLDAHPDASLEEAASAAAEIAGRVRMCFLPHNLDYLRAGGRVSNATALVGNLLGLHPCIEIIDGRLIAKKKYRGQTERLFPRVIQDFAEKHNLAPENLYFIGAPGLSEHSRDIAEKAAHRLGYPNITWMQTGCVITSHGGAKAFGVVGLSRA